MPSSLIPCRCIYNLVAIDLGADDDAQVIFETLNARGTPLLPIDLVKNYLFHQAEPKAGPRKALDAGYWQGFDEQFGFWCKTAGRGHAQRPRVDLFLQHYLAMLRRDEVAAGHIFAVFKEISGAGRDSEPSAGDQMRALSAHARIFRDFEEAPQSTPKGRFLYRLRAMDVTTVYPLLARISPPKKHCPRDRAGTDLRRSGVISRSPAGLPPIDQGLQPTLS